MSRHEKWIKIDKYKRVIFLKYTLKQTILRSLKKSSSTSNSKRYLAYFLLVRFPKISYISQLNHRCIVSGRIWNTNKLTGLSRFELRKSIYKSNVPGLRRASW